MESSCLMLMMTLYTAVDLDFVISESDLAKDGIETDHHITIFYANDIIVPKNNLLEDAKDILGEDTGYQELTDYLKDPDKVWPLYDIFGLDKFENQDFDVLVMRMKFTPSVPAALELPSLSLQKLMLTAKTRILCTNILKARRADSALLKSNGTLQNSWLQKTALF